MDWRRAMIRNNPSFRGQVAHSVIDNGAEFGGIPDIAPFCQSAACIVDAEPSGVAPWFLRTLGVRHFQQESLYDEFNAIAL